jgi:hypothetical protein
MISNNTFSIEQTTGVVTAGSSTITKSNDLVGVALTLKTSTVNTTAATLAKAALSARLTVGSFSIEQSDYFIDSGVAYLEFVLTEAAQKRIAYDDDCSIDFILSEKTGPRRTYTYTGGTLAAEAAAGLGDIVGPASSTANAIPRFNGTTGKLLKDSGATLDDAGNLDVASVSADSADVGVVNFTAALATDNTYSGLSIVGINGGATMAQWDVVYFSGADGEWMLADANAAGKFPSAGILTAATSNGAAASVMTQGIVRHDAWNWTPGGAIYLSTTAGGLTQTAPSTSGDCVQPVGYAITADIAAFNFNQSYAEVA